MDIGYLTALLGGALALLSPCGALLLPAFFASTVGTGPRLLGHGGVFYLGLSATLVPLGLGAALVGAAFSQHRDLLVTVTGWLVVAFGLMQVLGIGFDLRRLLPRSEQVAAASRSRTGLPRTFLLGTVSGVAGFCAGPILGAVLTLAATRGSPLLGGALLAVYAAGMVAPLLGVAWLWTRRPGFGRSVLRGRQLTIGRLRLHTTSLVTGLLLIVVGLVFVSTNGLASAPGFVSANTQADIQENVVRWGGSVPDVVVVLVLTLVAITAWFVTLRRRSAALGAGEATEEPS